ncbi:TetR family transcriptional regulator [Amycolatopsis deserti]|uniref:TetR family transcriptional regulator n=1 Tax=Amycolatopsis deserti TaxID=185696 RepID=A0ABQ3IG06_9PSEU|nr:TetR/AcrR family transcriptional regulator [Amycolatopsis deserti]GHE79911.1 TetR family transcriptional regulator [Amycolatopsis deserti]
MAANTPKRRADARENRDAILAVARRALAESPEISLNAIAKLAGVGNATLYRHFPTRESLVLAVYGRDVEEIREVAGRLLAERSPSEALREWMREFARCVLTRRGLAGALRLATGADRAQFAGTYQAMADALGELLAANERAGTVRPGLDPEIVLLALGSLWQLDPDGDWRKQADGIIDLLMAGLAGR